MSEQRVRWEANIQAILNRFLDGFLWACGAMTAVGVAALVTQAVL
jgi:hypothetical protein